MDSEERPVTWDDLESLISERDELRRDYNKLLTDLHDPTFVWVNMLAENIARPSALENYEKCKNLVGELEQQRDELLAALETIATSFPSKIMMNGTAKVGDPEHVKMCNNHMFIAQQAIAKAKGGQ